MRPIFLTLLLLLLCSDTARARSTFTEVTPQNISTLYRRFSLTSRDEGDGTAMFRLAIPAGQISPDHTCTLVISTGPIDLSPLQDSTYVNGELRLIRKGSRVFPILATCEISEKADQDTLSWEVRVRQTLLGQAALIFVEYGKRSSLDGNSFNLKKFADAR